MKESLSYSDRDSGEQRVEKYVCGYHQWLQDILEKKATVCHYCGYEKERDHRELNVEYIGRKRVEMKR